MDKITDGGVDAPAKKVIKDIADMTAELNSMFGMNMKMEDKNYRELFSGDFIRRKNMIQLKRDYYNDLAKNFDEENVNVVYNLTDEEIDQLFEEKELIDWVNFENYMTRTYKLDKPTHVRLLKEQFPMYYESRIEHAQISIFIQAKLFMLDLFGIQSLDDLKFLIALIKHDAHMHYYGNKHTSLMLQSVYKKVTNNNDDEKRYDIDDYPRLAEQLVNVWNRGYKPSPVISERNLMQFPEEVKKIHFI